MPLSHPFERLAASTRRRALPVLVLLTLALTLVMQIAGRSLQTAAAPWGIVSFELAGTLETAQAMLASWDRNAQLHAAFSLGLDYLYMPLYAVTIALACVQAASGLLRTPRIAAWLGILLAWALGLAALLDAVENLALFQVLLGSTSAAWPAVARWSAIVKFVLIIAGLLYAAAGVVAWLFSKVRN